MASPRSDLRELLKVTKAHWPRIAIATCLLLLGSVFSLAGPLVAGKIVDAAVMHRNTDELSRIVIVLIGVFAVVAVINYTHSYILNASGSRILFDLRRRVYSHLLYFDPVFFERRQVGELLSRMTSDLGMAQGVLTGIVPSGIKATAELIGTVGILFYINVSLASLILLILPLLSLAAILFGGWLRRLSSQQQDALGDISGTAEEVLGGIRTVQAFGAESYDDLRHTEKLGGFLGIQLKTARIGGAFACLLGLVSNLTLVLVLWYGGRLMINRVITPGELTTFLLYTGTVGASLNTLGSLYSGYQTLLGASARVFELMRLKPKVDRTVHPPQLDRVRGRIVFDRVCYQYESNCEKRALNEINLVIEPGQTIGLVGPSGAGKSTMFSLLMRFYDPTEGLISIDGKDIRNFDLRHLRRQMALVPQDVVLFSGSIYDNIVYGRRSATLAEVETACHAAGVAEFVKHLPKGYNEIVGQRGTRLSVGQRQRIAIARALLADPAILLLDEATSSLDPDSEKHVQAGIGTLLKDRTTLLIAHRLSTARLADRLFVIERGNLVASGTHEELYTSSELYRRYWMLQSLPNREAASCN